jgi:outer membrane autotransporter protein
MSALTCFSKNLLIFTAIGATFSGQAFGATATSGDAPVWVQVLYSDASQAKRTGFPGYDASTRGVGVGFDNTLSDQWKLGLTYRHLTTDVNVDNGNKTDIESQFVTLQNSFEQQSFFVVGSVSYGQSDHEAKQRIANDLIKAAYDSAQLGLNATAGYRYPLQGSVVIEPQLVARYARIDTDEIRVAGYSVGERRHEVGELGAGLRWVGRFDLGPGSMEQQIRLMGYRDFIADQSGTTALLLLGNTPFVTTGTKPKRNSYEVGLGADYRLGAVSLGLSWDYLGKSAYSSDTFTAKVRYDL